MENNCRLIDASAVLKHFDGYGFGQECDAEIILDYIAEGAPTVDAVEVVHGRWIADQVEAFSQLTEEPYLLDVLQCSVCGEYFDVSEARNYCPNCGAKMDGGNEDGS